MHLVMILALLALVGCVTLPPYAYDEPYEPSAAVARPELPISLRISKEGKCELRCIFVRSPGAYQW